MSTRVNNGSDLVEVIQAINYLERANLIKEQNAAVKIEDLTGSPSNIERRTLEQGELTSRAYQLLDQCCLRTCFRLAQPIFLLEELNFAQSGIAESTVASCLLDAEKRGSKRGTPATHLKLGHVFRFGNGAHIDLVKSEMHYRKALDLSKDTDNECGLYGASAYALGWLLNAERMESDALNEGLQLFTLAHSLGHPCASYAISYSLNYGIGVKRSIPASKEWLEIAIANGYTFAYGIKAENFFDSIDLDDKSPPGAELLSAVNLMEQAGRMRFSRAKVKKQVLRELRKWIAGHFSPTEHGYERFKWISRETQLAVMCWLAVNKRERFLLHDLALIVVSYICAAPALLPEEDSTDSRDSTDSSDSWSE